MTSAARPLQRDGDDRGVSGGGGNAPVEPFWLELARQAYVRRWHEENGDDYENSPNTYGDAK